MRYIIWIMVLFPVRMVTAQDAAPAFLSVLKDLDKDKMAYDYTVELFGIKNNKRLDMLQGSIYKLNAFYLDSNGAGINLRDADYALQINTRKKVAYVKSVRQIEARIRKKLPATENVMFDLNAMLSKNIQTSRTLTDSDGGRSVRITFKDAGLKEMIVQVSRDNVLVKLTVKSLTTQDGISAYYRVLTMQNFRDVFGDRLVSSRRFLGKGKGVLALKAPYGNYRINEIKY